MIVMPTKSPHEESDFYSGNTVVTDHRGWETWFSRRIADWSLILTLDGSGSVVSEGIPVTLKRHDLLVIEPFHPHEFIPGNHWNILWIHWIGEAKIVWPEPAPGLRKLSLQPTVYRRILAAMLDAHRLDLARTPGWYALARHRIEECLLRGNNVQWESPENQFSNISAALQLLMQSPQLNMDEIAESIGLSRATFYDRFKKMVGVSPRQYRELAMLRRAQLLLENHTLSIREIVDEIGMPNVFYFSNRFKKFYGISPAAYRKAGKDERS